MRRGIETGYNDSVDWEAGISSKSDFNLVKKAVWWMGLTYLGSGHTSQLRL